MSTPRDATAFFTGNKPCCEDKEQIKLDLNSQGPVNRLDAEGHIVAEYMGKTEVHEEFLRKKLIPVQKDHLRKQRHVEGRGYPEETVPEILSVKDSFFGHIFPM